MEFPALYRIHVITFLPFNPQTIVLQLDTNTKVVMVYHTDVFYKVIGEENYNDYVKFMESVGFSRFEKSERVLYRNVIAGIDIYSAYIEIKL